MELTAWCLPHLHFVKSENNVFAEGRALKVSIIYPPK